MSIAGAVFIVAIGVGGIAVSQSNTQRDRAGKESKTAAQRKQQIVDLLKSIETGDPKPAAAVNPQKYIQFGGKPTSFYDLFRVASGKIAEHWDTIETIPPKSEWKNSNGKF
jgi:predicted SnoaL-like aldol condensation-catalyzing enzyme